jgi:hypothetical protein
VATVATALCAALNAETHPFFAAITWTVDTATITGTADVAGCPFIAASSKTGGTGTIGAYAAVTACTGPAHFSNVDNWSDGIVPVATDVVIWADNANPMLWDIDQNAITLGRRIIRGSYTGRIGLNRYVFVQSADGKTSTNDAYEYRECYFKISATADDIDGSGSDRLMLNSGTNATTLNVLGACASSADYPRAPLRYLNVHTDSVAYIRGGGLGTSIAADLFGETSQFENIFVSADAPLELGEGVTVDAAIVAQAGSGVIRCAATLPLLTLNGGEWRTEGDFIITTTNVYSGAVLHSNHIKTAGVAHTTLNIDGGRVNSLESTTPRTWTTVNWKSGQWDNDPSVVTVTTLNEGDSAPFSGVIQRV